jgi:mono/diheme cytochrome c family protein
MDMPAQAYLTDQQIADVLTYVRGSLGNKYPAVTAAQVKAERK